ncbi:MAG: hypothetical protein U1D97_10220 [Desulfuromonadales bacterium]|nr:hypothetical protein [Desulfuromonadales bacterium]
MILAMLTPFLAFVLCAGTCLIISRNNNKKFKATFSELIWPMSWFAIPCALIACLWVLIAFSDVAQGVLYVFIAGPVGFALGELIGLVYWTAKNKTLQEKGNSDSV